MGDVVYEILGTLCVMGVLVLVQVFKRAAGRRKPVNPSSNSAHARKYGLNCCFQ